HGTMLPHYTTLFRSHRTRRTGLRGFPTASPDFGPHGRPEDTPPVSAPARTRARRDRPPVRSLPVPHLYRHDDLRRNGRSTAPPSSPIAGLCPTRTAVAGGP